MRSTWVLGVVLAVASASAGAADSTCNSMKRAVRDFTARHAPQATAAQARNWGLLLPPRLDPARPLIVLLHGLDADRSDCVPIGELLRQAGFQVAYFGYPGDQPIRDDSRAVRMPDARASPDVSDTDDSGDRPQHGRVGRARLRRRAGVCRGRRSIDHGRAAKPRLRLGPAAVRAAARRKTITCAAAIPTGIGHGSSPRGWAKPATICFLNQTSSSSSIRVRGARACDTRSSRAIRAASIWSRRIASQAAHK